MEFKEKITNYFQDKGVAVGKVEQEDNAESIVCHVEVSDNEKVSFLKEEMEKELDVAVIQSDMYGMNVVIVESNILE